MDRQIRTVVRSETHKSRSDLLSCAVRIEAFNWAERMLVVLANKLGSKVL